MLKKSLNIKKHETEAFLRRNRIDYSCIITLSHYNALPIEHVESTSGKFVLNDLVSKNNLRDDNNIGPKHVLTIKLF